MLQSVSNGMCKIVKKVVPSPYVLAIFLTLLTFLLGWILTPSTFINMCNYMGAGMFSLLSFTMQMVLVLVTGHILANAPIVKKWLVALAHLPRSRTQAIVMVGVIGFLATYINWGFGLVVGAIIAKEVAKSMHGNHVHYPLLIAVAYAGNIARGPSSAIAIAPASADSIVYDFVGVVPVSQTLFSSWNLIITALVLLVSLIMFTRMQPSEENAIEISLSAFGDDSAPVGNVVPKNKEAGSFAAKLDNNVFLAYIPAIIVIIYLVSYFYAHKSLNFDLNIVIAIFFALGALAHKTPGAYSRAMGEAIKSAAGITLQFMFYAAITGMMKNSGLAVLLADFFVNIASAKTLPMFTFLSAGILNIFIPSGGGQWAVQGPIMLDACARLDADPARVIMAMCWGDSWTNQIQPFWALPALAIAGLDVQDIMGYCMTFAVVIGIILSVCFLVL